MNIAEEEEEDREYALQEEQRRANIKKLRRRRSRREWAPILVSAAVALAWWFWPSQYPFYILGALIILAHHKDRTMNQESDGIRAVIFQDGDLWVAQCLEYDIGAQAFDVDTVRRPSHGRCVRGALSRMALSW